MNYSTPYFLKFLQGVALAAMVAFSGCGKKEKSLDDMSFKELASKSKDALASKKAESAIVYLEKLITQFPEHQQLGEYKLKLADLYLKDGRHESAYILYENFNNLYPCHAKAEYAHYKQVLAKFYQTLKINQSCDSTLTENAVELCNSYLENKAFTQYRQDVSDIVTTCQNRLLDKEVHIFSTYLRRNKYASARNRLAFIKEKFLAKNKALEPRILFLECKLAHKQNNKTEEEKLFNNLVEQYPESQFTRMAQGFIAKPKGFVF